MTTLRLRYSRPSPFARKVLVFAHEAGLADRIALDATDVWASDSDITRDNPLGKIPALIGPDGTFIGSYLCCDYLDTLHDRAPLIPRQPPERWLVLQRHALADGVMEAAVAHVTEARRRPTPLVYQGMLDRQAGKIARALDTLEQDGAVGRRPDISTVTLGCTLGYLDFRLPQLDWRAGRPRLAAWEADFLRRPVMQATLPADPPSAS